MRNTITENKKQKTESRIIKKSIRSGFRVPRPEKGFTLIEVMVALVVMLLGMLGTMAMQYYAVNGNAFSREMRIATNLGQQKLEELKTTSYANLTAAVTDAPPAGNAISGGLAFTRRWWVVADCLSMTLPGDNRTCGALAAVCSSDPDGAVAVASSAIRVRTCWFDKNGINHSVTLDSARWNENVIP